MGILGCRTVEGTCWGGGAARCSPRLGPSLGGFGSLYGGFSVPPPSVALALHIKDTVGLLPCSHIPRFLVTAGRGEMCPVAALCLKELRPQRQVGRLWSAVAVPMLRNCLPCGVISKALELEVVTGPNRCVECPLRLWEAKFFLRHVADLDMAPRFANVTSWKLFI